MTRKNIVMLIGLVGLMVLLLAARELVASDPTRRNWEIFTEMQYSAAYEPQSPNPNFANGRTAQHLPDGVVVRGHEPFRFGASPEEAERAGRELVNPWKAGDTKALELGGRLYGVYCAVCHGGSGDGDGPVIARGVVRPTPLGAARARAMKDGQIFHVLTKGQGNMASYAAQLTPRERWAVVRYVRVLQGAKR